MLASYSGWTHCRRVRRTPERAARGGAFRIFSASSSAASKCFPVWNQAVDQPQAIKLGGLHRLPGNDHLSDYLEGMKAFILARSGTGQASLGLGDAKLSVLRGDDQVALGGDGRASAQGIPVDGSDDRLPVDATAQDSPLSCCPWCAGRSAEGSC